MKLLLRRDQRAAMLGSKPVFQLDVRAEISADEKGAIDKYKLGKTMLYEKNPLVDRGSGLLGLASRMAHHAMNISVSVDDLTSGKRIECKDILEVIAVEEQLKEAGQNFVAVLRTAQHFGGEEVLEL